MAEDIVTILSVETGGSEKTIKALKEEIKELKKTLETTTIGSESFKKASKDLAMAQNELKSALERTKQTAEVADGSYNALVATMAELKKQWKATSDEVERSEIGAKIDEINSQLKELDASIGNNQRNVGNYKQDFIDAMAEMKQEGVNFGNELSNLNKKTEVTKNALDGVGQVASGVASGFAAIQGVSALFGIENENLEKSLVKVQSAMAIAQGIGGMKGLVEGGTKLIAAFRASRMASAALETQTTATSTAMTASAGATNVATGALQGFKAALISTGIGALVVALGTLIGYLLTLGDTTEEVVDDFDSAQKAVDDFVNKIEKLKNTNDYAINLKIAGGASDEDIWLERRKAAREVWLQAERDANDIRKKYGEESEEYEKAMEQVNNYKSALQKVNQDYNIWLTEQRTKEYEQAQAINERAIESQIDTKEEELAILEEKYKQEKELLIAHNLSTAALDEEYLQKRKEIEEKYNEPSEAQKIAEEARKAVIDTKEEELRELENIYLERKALLEKEGIDAVNLTEVYQQERQAIIDKYDNAEKQKAEEKARFLDRLRTSMGGEEQEIAEIDRLFEQYKNQFQLNAEELFILEEWKQSELAKIRDKYREQEQSKEWVFLQNMTEDTKALIANTTQSVASAAAGASQILSALAASQDQTTREGFEKAKNMQIASATMNMLAGITAALSGLFTTKTGPWDLVLAAIQAATIATTGGIQIANIRKQTYNNSGGGNVGTIPNIPMNDIMPIQYTRELMTDTELTDINREQRVYVLESDITDVQDNVKVKEENSSF